MRTSSVNLLRWALAGGFTLGSALVLPAACLYPDYTFDEPEASTSSGTTSSATTSGAGGQSGGSTGSGALGGGGAGPTGGAGGSAGSGGTTSSSSSSTSGTAGGGGVGGSGGTGSTSSSSSSTSSGTGGSGGSTGGTGGTGGVPPPEDCLNTVDDDGDGAVDCEDDECGAGYACVPAAPVGWAGYVALWKGDPLLEPLMCPYAFPSQQPYVGNSTLVFSSPTCTTCSCGVPEQQTCKLQDMNASLGGLQYLLVSDKGCAVAPVTPQYLSAGSEWTGTCSTGIGGLLGGDVSCGGACNVSVRSDPAVVAGGLCQPMGGVVNKPEPAWAIRGKACGHDTMPGLGCGSGKVCQPRTTATGFNAGLCIYKGGELQCPAGSFNQKHVLYETYTDSRQCSPCGCDPPVGGSCSLSISVYSDQAQDTCTTSVATFASGGCTNLVGNPAVFGRKYIVSQPPSGGSCGVKPGGGAPSGTVTATSATTFCCMPP